MNILDPAFVYVPASKQHEHGVLARWREQRKNMGESKSRPAEPDIDSGEIAERSGRLQVARPLNVKQLRRK